MNGRDRRSALSQRVKFTAGEGSAGVKGETHTSEVSNRKTRSGGTNFAIRDTKPKYIGVEPG
jgi:hypothetical protein